MYVYINIYTRVSVNLFYCQHPVRVCMYVYVFVFNCNVMSLYIYVYLYIFGSLYATFKHT